MSLLRFPPVEAETAGERAYRRIRADILAGVLAPAQKLRLDALRQGYGASVSTLRETLGRLVAERLVVAEGQRGFEVAPCSARDLCEVAELRLLLETHALEHAFHAGDVEWEARVVAAHHALAQSDERLRAGDDAAMETWKRYDWSFHQALISACGSQSLITAHAAIFDRYLRYQILVLGWRGEVARAEHRALMDAALARDAAAARAVLLRHIVGGVEHALATGALDEGAGA